MWEKAHVMRQVGIRKTSVTAYEVSKTADDVKTGCEHERGRRGRVGTGSGVCGAVREMEVGWPSGASLRGAASKHRALRPLRRFVVSGTEKARCQRVSWGPKACQAVFSKLDAVAPSLERLLPEPQ